MIAFWKSLLTGTFNVVSAALQEGGVRKLCGALSRGVVHVAMAATFQCFIQLGFTLSFLLTDPAMALLLVNLNPLWAALLGVTVLGEALPFRTVVALVLALLSLACVFIPNFVDALQSFKAALNDHGPVLLHPPEQGPSDVSHLGNAIALATGLAVALYLTVVRHAALHSPQASMSASSGLGVLLAAALSAAAAAVRALPLYEPSRLADAVAFCRFVLIDSVAIATAVVLQNLALRKISGTSVALVVLLQVGLAPLFVYLGIGIAPDVWTIVGGTLLLSVLAGHELAAKLADESSDIRSEVLLLL